MLGARVAHGERRDRVSSERKTVAVDTAPVRPTLLAAGFFMLGVPVGGLGVAWPQMRQSFGASASTLGIVLAVFWALYALGAAQPGRTGWLPGTVLVFALGLCGVGLFLVAAAPALWWCAAAASITGMGCGLLDATMNTLAAQGVAVRRLNMFHAFFAIGATTSPAIFAITMRLRWSWRVGFVVIALAYAATAVGSGG